MSINYSKLGFTSLASAEMFYNALNDINSISKTKDTYIYHYTTTAVLNAILKSAAFRATNIFYLNDYKEYKSGVDHLKKVFDKDSTVLSYLDEIKDLDAMSRGGVYSISFSGDGDELRQWTTYAKESGVCIEFDPMIIWSDDSKLAVMLKNKDEDDGCLITSPCFRKLIYIDRVGDNSDNQEKLYKEAFAKRILNAKTPREAQTNEEKITKCWKKYDKDAKAFLKLIASYYKERSFGGENEIRAVFLPLYDTIKSGTNISYFEQPNGVLRPYIDVTFIHCYEKIKEEPEIPLKSIRVGPGRDKDKVYKSIIHRIENGEVRTWKYTPEELQNKYMDYMKGFYTWAHINMDKQKKEPMFSFLSRISQDVTFDIYYHKTSYDIVCGEKPEDVDYRKFDSTKDDGKSDTFLKYQDDVYMTSKGILITKSEISYLY